MSIEIKQTMPEIRSQDINKEIRAIQDIAVILTGASQFVCKRRMRKRFSKHLDESLERLEDHIALVKKQFPGKISDASNLDKSLAIIRDVALILREDNADIEARCRSGELGDKLSLVVAELKTAIKAILDALTGNFSRYSIFDRCSEYGGRIRFFLFRFSPVVSNIGRIFLAASFLFVFSFAYLALTMKTEDAVLKDIKRDLIVLQKQKDILKKRKEEYKEIKEKLKYFDQSEMDREDKIQWLNLSVEEKKSRELIDQTMISIETVKKKITENRRKAERIRNKSFFRRLFKR